MEKKREGSDEQSEPLAKKPKEEFEKGYECESCQQLFMVVVHVCPNIYTIHGIKD